MRTAIEPSFNIIDASSPSAAQLVDIELLCASLRCRACFHTQNAVGRTDAHYAGKKWQDANPAPGANASGRGQTNQDQPDNNPEDSVNGSNICLHCRLLVNNKTVWTKSGMDLLLCTSSF
jgi:hypothetical protein